MYYTYDKIQIISTRSFYHKFFVAHHDDGILPEWPLFAQEEPTNFHLKEGGSENKHNEKSHSIFSFVSFNAQDTRIYPFLDRIWSILLVLSSVDHSCRDIDIIVAATISKVG